MRESYLRQLLHSILDNDKRAETLARFAAVIAGLTAFALAVAPAIETGGRMDYTYPARGAVAAHENGARPLPSGQYTGDPFKDQPPVYAY